MFQQSKIARSVLFLAVLFIAPLLSAQSLIIGEFRVRGPNGANDEFIELYNNSNSSHTVTASSGTGYGIAASDGVVRCTVPNGTVIPARGHYLCTNSVGYSLAGYAAGDATYATDIPDNAGIALFTTNLPVNFAVGTRLDAAGSVSEANTLYREGSGYLSLTPFSIDYAFVRDQCGKQGSISNFAPCTSGGLLIDTNDNAVDFIFVDSNGTSAGAGQRLGAAGPENLGDPTFGTAAIAGAALDSCSVTLDAPNYVRDLTSVPASNSTFGTVDIRGTFTNNTGAPLTELRFRVIDLTTFPAASGIADLRPRTSPNLAVTVDRAPCGSGTSNPTVAGTTLEQPPNQPNGGGFNSSLTVPAVAPGTPLPNGASIDVRFLMGVQQNGRFRVALVPEGLPQGGNTIFAVSGNTGGPNVLSVTRVDADPAAASSIIHYLVTFDQTVTIGVDSSDFTLTTTGTIAGASVTGVSGSGTTRTVTVNSGTGTGTIRLNVVDDDTIMSGTPQSLAGTRDGSYTSGEVYTITAPPPTVVSVNRASPDPTISGSVVSFTVTFSEAVTGVDVTDFSLANSGSIAGDTITGVTGSGATRTVTVNTGTGTGTIRLDVVDDDTILNAALVPLGGAGAGNGSFANGQSYTVNAPPPVVVPTLDPRALALLAGLLAAAAVLILKRT